MRAAFSLFRDREREREREKERRARGNAGGGCRSREEAGGGGGGGGGGGRFSPCLSRHDDLPTDTPRALTRNNACMN